MNSALAENYARRIKDEKDTEAILAEAIQNEKLFVFGELLARTRVKKVSCRRWLIFHAAQGEADLRPPRSLRLWLIFGLPQESGKDWRPFPC